MAITAPDNAPMPTSSIHISTRHPRAALMALVVLFGLAGCQPQSRAAAAEPESAPAPVPDAVPGTVVLGFGDETTIAAGTQLRFLRVVNDSRCPKGAQCVWAGEVTVEFEVTSASGKSRFELASAREATTAVGALQFELKDYGACPAASKRLADAECATVAITAAATR